MSGKLFCLLEKKEKKREDRKWHFYKFTLIPQLHKKKKFIRKKININ